MMKRRELLVALGASVLTAPLFSVAQPQDKVWRVGFLSQRARPDSLDSDVIGAFHQGMRVLGYIEGKNLVIEWRFAERRIDLLPVLAAELVRLQVDVIVINGLAAGIAARKATATIPIVFPNTGDPVAAGFVKSLARPGGNMTGLSNISGDIVPKHLEMHAQHGAQAYPRGCSVESIQQVQYPESGARPIRGDEDERKDTAGGSTHRA